MGSLSIWHWLVLIVVVMLLFGRGKMSEMMGDFAKGINSFKKGLADDDSRPATPPVPPQVTQTLPPQPVSPVIDEQRR